jgi:hypothetical protein
MYGGDAHHRSRFSCRRGGPWGADGTEHGDGVEQE